LTADPWVEELREQLCAVGDEERAVGAKAYLKSDLEFIRKAIGWVLRDVSKKRPQLAHEFLSKHIDEVSGLTLREGSKYLPEAQRNELRCRYRDR